MALAPILTLFKKSEGHGVNSEIDVNKQLLWQLNKKKIPSWQQLKKITEVLDKKEKFQALIALIIFITSLFGLGWQLFLHHSVAVPAYGGSYAEGLIGSPNFINPTLATSDVDRDLVKLIFSGLVKFDGQGNIVPDLAAGYTIDAEQKVYTFELKDEIYWHDGEKILADDVVFTVNRIKDPEFKSPLRSSFNGIQINKLNDRTVQFTLEQPFAPFLSILTFGIIPEHLWYSIPAFSAELAELNKKPIGSGPYKLKSLTKDQNGNIKNYTLVAWDKYYEGQPYIDELMLKFYPDFETAVAALENKNIEGLVYLPRQYKDEIKNKELVLKNLRFPQYTGLFFNPNNNELLKNVDFRKALALAIDKKRILTEALNNDGQIIEAPILPGLLGYNPEIKDVAFDPAAAADILQKLKWVLPEDNSSKFRRQNDQELTIKLTTIDQPENVKAVSIIQEAWEAIGIKTELDIVAKSRIKTDTIEPRAYQVLLFGQVININSGPYPFWHSSQIQGAGLNLSIFADKDIDANLEKSRTAKTDSEKIELLKNFQTKLLANHFAIFLYNPTYIYPVSKKLQGLENLGFINVAADRFVNINTWYINTKRQLSN